MEEYLKNIAQKFARTDTAGGREMIYRTDFEILLKQIFHADGKVTQINHDSTSDNGNKPDFVISKNSVPILYIEAKDIGISLDKVEKSEQMARYYGYTNLVLTDYVEFRFYRNGLSYEEPIKIANYDIKNRAITPIPENYGHVAKTLIDFTQSQKEPIRSGKHLSKIMGGRARRIRDNVRQFLITQSDRNAELVRVYETIKKLLVHDLTTDAFADMYAQTLVYGLFVARYHDETKKDFSRREALDLVPASNPFLRHFFDHIVGADFDKRLGYIVDELCEVFSHANIPELIKEYFKLDLWGKSHMGPDPVIHFYEDFLQEYDDTLRKKMGAYYTPLPVVQFIVRSVDNLLEKEFGLGSGLADTTKTASGMHKVQILDPAVGTGTFLSEVLDKIHARFTGQMGRWPAYVHSDLLPRLHGFELMMAPYTIAHLKLSMKLAETGFTIFNKGKRLGIYLTNSLESSAIKDDLFTGFGFAESIAEESKEASIIKNETPIMVVLGNPPYSGVSSNETDYANSLVERYKVEPEGTQKLQERKHWLNDDYVKFIAFAESMIEKNGEGIMAMITNHGYIDNPTFRGMRWHLAKTFDKMYILDLHGNAKKKEIAPDGSKDENVFNIQQGVAIIIGIKTGKKKVNQLSTVYHADLFGKRSFKFAELENEPAWKEVDLDEKMFYFVGKDMAGREEYDEGFSVVELFPKNTTGIVTGIDKLSIFYTKDELKKMTSSILNSDNPYTEFNIKDGRKYKKEERLKELRNASENQPERVSYRPFDTRYMYYTEKSECWINSPRSDVMKHFVGRENIGLMLCRQQKIKGFQHILIHRGIVESSYVSNKTSEIGSSFPLYLYADDGSRVPNLNKEIVAEIEKTVGATTPEEIFDYIYAVLYSPSYREKYKEFLKIDFPRVPYPKDKKQFSSLAMLGKELRELHLLESPKVNQFITTYSVGGSDIVEKLIYKDNKIFINTEQYFGDVPGVAWDFYIGGYQPAQKWLKDRKGRILTNTDIEHYQKIIVALVKTDGIMKEIDKII
jgi:hypothetical protein